jgi:hypothetical protein
MYIVVVNWEFVKTDVRPTKVQPVLRDREPVDEQASLGRTVAGGNA